VAREISKLHEEIKTAPLAQLKAHFSAKEVKGEIVVVVGGTNH
jgi:16S rRNA (cytidine1402-2'-O)-methyltransferase